MNKKTIFHTEKKTSSIHSFIHSMIRLCCWLDDDDDNHQVKGDNIVIILISSMVDADTHPSLSAKDSHICFSWLFFVLYIVNYSGTEKQTDKTTGRFSSSFV